MPNITIEKQEAIHKLYKKGYNVALIADALKLNPNSVKKYMQFYNNKLKIKRLYFEENKGINEISKEMSLTPNQVRSYVKKIEIDELKRGRR